MPPTLYIKNALRISEIGLGDGTVYYSGSSAVVDQANKTFALPTIAKIDDIATPIDDTLNGHILYFPVSKNKYHIVDFVASTGKVTTWEVPQAVDNGQAWEVRRALLDNKALASNPALRLADGQRFSKWKRSELGAITIALPNLIKENNGFESGDLSGWAVVAGTPAVNATSPILGKYDASIGANDRLWARLRGPIKETTYRVLFKAGGGGPQGLFLQFVTVGQNFILDYTWSNASSGTIVGNAWHPALDGTTGWRWADITINTHHEGDAYLAINNHNAGATALNIDEVYVFEKVDVGSIWLIDEDNSSGYRPTVTGCFAPEDRTGISTEDSTLMVSNKVLLHHELHEFVGGVSPIYKIAFSGIVLSASQMLLCDKWAIPYDPILRKPNRLRNQESVFTARSGVEQTIRRFQEIKREGTFEALSDADLARYRNDWVPHHFTDKSPFAVRWSDGQSPMLMINNDPESGEEYTTILSDWHFKFKAVKG